MEEEGQALKEVFGPKHGQVGRQFFWRAAQKHTVWEKFLSTDFFVKSFVQVLLVFVWCWFSQ